MMQTIKVTFPCPQPGYYDGNRAGGEFKPEPGCTFKPKSLLKWGCYSLNFWFVCGTGRTEKEAASIAARWIKRHIAVEGSTVELIDG